ncbi:nucleoside monophosphate kinase [Actinomadura gamaensis]|uniref:Adenylate kinase n=1 Tax=Actinomadura gamaensis TaxID=1763541 RepID=A0ABV9TS65_9ACTN
MTELCIFVIAAPVMGKERPAALLASQLSLPRFSAGDAFRVNFRDRTDLWWQAKAYLDRGEAIADEVMVAMVGEQLALDGVRDGFVLDGFPCTVPQAHAFNQMLAAEFGVGLDLVLRPVVDYEQVLRQWSGRRSCGECHRLWHVDDDDVQDGLCGDCGSTLYQRDDDKEEAVRPLLHSHQEWSAALARIYADETVVLDFDATGTAEEAAHQALQAIQQSPM